MEVTTDTEHRATALARLIGRWRDKPKFAAIVRVYLDEIQALENACAEVRTARRLATATGAQLDVLGRIVGEPRRGRDDETYRLWIGVRIAINSSNGRAREIIAILKKASALTFRFWDFGRESLQVEYLEAYDAAIYDLAEVVQESRGGGKSACVVFPTTALAGTFQLKTVDGADSAAIGLGDASGGSTDGGLLATVVPRRPPNTVAILDGDGSLLGFGPISGSP